MNKQKILTASKLGLTIQKLDRYGSKARYIDWDQSKDEPLNTWRYIYRVHPKHSLKMDTVGE